MPFEVLPVTDDDYAVFVPPLFSTMGSAGFVAGLYPENGTERGQKLATERFKIEKASNPGIRWMKVVDKTTMGEDGKPKIAGVAQWAVLEDASQHYANCFEVAPKGTWANDLDERYAYELWESYIRPRRKVLKEERLPIICLQILCVWPEYQKRGAGRKLMEWGGNKADAINAVCTVEASTVGQRLYEKCGYELQEQFSLEVSEEFKHKLSGGGVRFMVRPRKD